MSRNPAMYHCSRPFIRLMIAIHLFLGRTISISAITTVPKVIPNKTTPNGWFRKASIGLRCAIREKVVVMPHIGHGKVSQLIMMQGSSPNCICVPTPVGSGVSHAARPRTVAVGTNRAAAKSLGLKALTRRLHLEVRPQSSPPRLLRLDRFRRVDPLPGP
jgi:hypothetical protein